jgi:hypothetical protein
MGIFGSPKISKKNLIKIEGVKDVRQSLKKLGETDKTSRSLINKALRPAAKKAVKALKMKYKHRTKNIVPGQRYDPQSKTKKVGKSIADSIGIITPKRSKNPGLFVGTRLKNLNPTWVGGKRSRNLPAMLINGTKNRKHKSGKSVGRVRPQTDFYKEVIAQKGNDISATAQRDMMKMLDGMIKKAGFK